jgi:hypothetical protein
VTMSQHETNTVESRGGGAPPKAQAHLALIGSEVLKRSEQRAEAACDLVLRHPSAVHERIACGAAFTSSAIRRPPKSLSA